MARLPPQNERACHSFFWGPNFLPLPPIPLGYIGGLGEVYELYQSGGKWVYDELTEISGAHHAQKGAITSWVSSTDSVQHVAYIGGDAHVYEIYKPVGQQPWHYDDLTQISRAPPCSRWQGDVAITSWVSSTDNLQDVAYIGDDGHVYEKESSERPHRTEKRIQI